MTITSSVACVRWMAETTTGAMVLSLISSTVIAPALMSSSASTSVGTNQLLREGAWVAADPSDVLEVLEIDAASPVERAAQHRHAAAQATRILEALHVRPESRDGLARRLRCAPDQLTLDLLQLELDGRVAEDRDGRLRAVVPVRASVRAPRRPMRDS